MLRTPSTSISGVATAVDVAGGGGDVAKSDDDGQPSFGAALWSYYLLAVLLGQLPKQLLETAFGLPEAVSQVSFLFAGILLLMAARQTVVLYLSDGRKVRRRSMLSRFGVFVATTLVVIIGAFALFSGTASFLIILRDYGHYNPLAGVYTHAQLLDFLLSTSAKAVVGDLGEIFGVGLEHPVSFDARAHPAFGIQLYLFQRMIGWGLVGTIALVAHALLLRRWFAKPQE